MFRFCLTIQGSSQDHLGTIRGHLSDFFKLFLTIQGSSGDHPGTIRGLFSDFFQTCFPTFFRLCFRLLSNHLGIIRGPPGVIRDPARGGGDPRAPHSYPHRGRYGKARLQQGRQAVGIPLRGYMGGSESHFMRIELHSDLLPGVFGAMKWLCPTLVSPPDVARQII